MSEQSRCRSCGAPIWWAVTEKGGRMPLDPDPVPDGNVVINNYGVAVVITPGDWTHDGQRYVAHFATCPNAKTHRKGNH